MELLEKRQVPAVGLWFNVKRGKDGTEHFNNAINLARKAANPAMH